MDSQQFTGAPGARLSDPERDPRPDQEPEALRCADCGALATGSVPNKPLCDACCAWRVAQGVLFDPRPREMLQREVTPWK